MLRIENIAKTFNPGTITEKVALTGLSLHLAPGEFVMRDGNPGLFKGRPSKYNCFASRRAAELAALRFTGRGIKTHVAPTEGVLAGTILTDKGYFFAIDGLGDLGVEPVLKKIEPRGSGFVLTGEIPGRDVFME